MAVIGRASVLVSPSFKGLQRQVSGEMQPAATKAGKGFSGTFSKWAKRGIKVGIAAAGALAAGALAKGFQRLKSIEEAQAKLRGLGYDAATVEKVMANALAAVKGTSFGLGEAATTAASMIAAGIKPGQELEAVLKSVANSAAAAGVGMDEMGAIYGKVASLGKAQNDVLRQVAERGIPIYETLAKMFGVTTAEVEKMAREGKIGFEDFEKAMSKASGTVAKEMGETFTGRLANAWAALGRIGANLLSGVFPKLGKALGAITSAMEPLEDQAAALGAAFGDLVSRGFARLQSAWPSIKAGFLQLWQAAKPIFPTLRDIGAALVPLVSGLKNSGVAFSVLKGAVSGVATVLSGVAKFARENGTAFRTLVVALGAGVAAFKAYRAIAAATLAVKTAYALATKSITVATTAQTAAMKANTLATRAGTAAGKTHLAITKAQELATRLARSTLGTFVGVKALELKAWLASTAAKAKDLAVAVAHRTAIIAGAVATKAAAAGQWLLNAAMAANPIGLVVAALVALGAGLVLAYKKSETFRKIVDAAWAGIKAAALAVVNWFTGTALPVLKAVFTAVGNAAKWLWSNAIQPAVNAIVAAWRRVSTAVSAVWSGFISPIFQLIGAIVKWLAVNIFQAYVATITRLWRGLGAVVRAVWNSVIKPVINYFSKSIQGWKKLISAAIGVVQRTWSNLGALWRQVYTKHLKPIVDAFKRIVAAMRTFFAAQIANVRATWTALGTAIRSVYSRTIAVVVTAFRTAVSNLRASIATQVAGVKTLWAGLGTAIRNVYNRNLKPVIDALKRAVRTVKDAFKAGVDGARNQWARLEAAAKKPVRFVINTVLNNGLIAGFNKLAKTFGTKQMSKLALPKGFDTGGFTGRLDPRKVAGVVHGREWVINARSTGQFERKFPGYLKHINDTGTLPGYRKGGQVQPVPGRGNRHTSGYGWATWAGDFPQPMGTPVKAWKDGVVAAVRHLTTSYGKHVRMNHTDGSSSLYAHLSKILVRVGQQLTAGQRLGLVGSTGNSTGPHLHFETMKGAFSGGSGSDDGGGGFDLLGAIKNFVSGPIKRLKEIKDTPFGTLVAGAGNKIGDMFKEKAAGLFKNVTDKISGAAGTAGIAAKWGGLITKHLIKNRMPLTLLDNFIRQIQSESGGNPSAVQQVRDVNWPHNKAVGLLQIIPGTFAQYRDPSLPNDRKNGEASIAASIRYVKARYGKSAESVIGKGHGYDSGGLLQPGYTLAYNGTSRPEPVFTGSQWDKIDSLLARQGTQQIRGELVLKNGKAYIEGIVADVARDAGLVRS